MTFPFSSNKQRLNILELFQPNAACTDLNYTPAGDISIDGAITPEHDGDTPYEFAVRPKLFSFFSITIFPLNKQKKKSKHKRLRMVS